MSPTEPALSSVLAAQGSKVPTDTFLKILDKAVYPALDTLPEATRFEILSTIAVAAKGIGIDFAAGKGGPAPVEEVGKEKGVYSDELNNSIAAFRKQPTFKAYEGLLKLRPSLQKTLWRITERHFFQKPPPPGPWAQAVQIFIDVDSAEDVLQSLKHMDAVSVSATAARRMAVSYLMVKSDNYRAHALLYLEKGLRTVLVALRQELHQVYPDLDKAYIHLEGQFEALKYPKRLGNDRTFTAMKMRSERKKVLTRFVALAKNYDEASSSKNPELSAGDNLKQPNGNARKHGTATQITKWGNILTDWLDVTEATRMGCLLGFSADPLYAVDGVADILREHCDEQEHVAESISAAYYAFGPGPEELIGGTDED